MKTAEIKITIPQFNTHVNKNKSTKIKINAQTIYSGVNHFTRGSIVHQIHAMLEKHLPKNLNLKDMFPLSIRVEIHIPINYESVKWSNKQQSLVWKPPAKYHEPTFDADNQWLWIKCFQDVLQHNGIVPKDTVMYIPDTGRVTFVPVKTLDERKLVFVITRHTAKWRKIWLDFFGFFGKERRRKMDNI